ncbi:MAG TPA: hypothetical protein VFT82_01410 [Candidatus Paceibacterota bacterium]|nr:hypothetical protein [Candidatus Paceibacterota bacterium]
MKITPERLRLFDGGQLEFQNLRKGHLFRGEIKDLTICGEEIRVSFAWLAKGIGYPPYPTEWVVHEIEDYVASLLMCFVGEIGEGRLMLQLPHVGETAVLFPRNGSKLSPSNVKGLAVEK